jgi:hypothetical protein
MIRVSRIVALFLVLAISPLTLYAQSDDSPPTLVEYELLTPVVDVSTDVSTAIVRLHSTDDVSGMSYGYVTLERPDGTGRGQVCTLWLVSG